MGDITMRIEIKRKGNQTAILISFDINSQKFESNYERNKFFSELYGRKQIVIKQSGRYEYRREGLLDEIPHIKVDNSVFIVAMEHMGRMMEFFKEWQDKVETKTFPVILKKKKLRNLKKKLR